MSSQEEITIRIRIDPLTKEEKELLRLLSSAERKQILIEAAKRKAQELSRKEDRR